MIANFFDTETTGTPDREPFTSDPTLGPEITEYCIATWNDGNVTEVVHELVTPRNWRECCEVDAEGIVRTLDGFPLSFREDTWRGKGYLNKTDCQEFHKRLPSAMVIGSNPAFDIERVQWELRRAKHAPLPYVRRVDTSSLGVFLLCQGVIEGTGLERLAKFFNVEHEAHTSKGDVMAAIKVFENFVELYYSHPRRMREALVEIAECSPDPDMAKFAAEATEPEAVE